MTTEVSTLRPRVALYMRVSTDEQAQAGTVENQRHACEAFCTAKGYEVTGEFADEGVSGTIALTDRPYGGALLAAAADGDAPFSRVVCYTPDRLGRNVQQALNAMSEFKRLAVPVDFVVQSFDATPEGVLQFNVLLSVAQYEREVIVRRTMQGRHRRARAGKFAASVPAYGYARGADGVLVINAAEADVVRRVFQHAADDWGTQRITDALNADGVTPPRHFTAAVHNAEQWGPTTIAKLLKAERYTGVGKYGPETMAYPVIVEPAMYAAARKRIDRHKTFNRGPLKGFYLLRGLARCRTCGAACISGVQGRARSVAYDCGSRRRGKHEGRYRWYGKDVEPAVLEWLRRLLSNPDRLTARLEAWAQSEISGVEDFTAAVERLEAEIGNLIHEEDKALRAFRRDIISEGVLARHMNEIAVKRARLITEREDILLALSKQGERIRQRDQLRELLARLREKGIFGLEGIDQATAVFSTATDLPTSPEAWREVLQKLGLTVWLEPDGGVTLEGVLSGQPTQAKPSDNPYPQS